MPRPILKTLSSYASPQTNSKTNGDERRIALKRHTGATRCVTFSPFTKPSLKPSTPDLTGFTFSSPTSVRETSRSRRRRELQNLHTLYRAAKRNPHSIKTRLLASVPGFKQLHTCTKHWLEFGRRLHDAVLRHQSTHSKRLPRMIYRVPWTALNGSDHEYVQQLTLSPKSLSKPYSQHSILDDHPLLHRVPQLNLTSPNQGHFTELLRREGMLADEDERQMRQALDEDLRGINQLTKRRRKKHFLALVWKIEQK
ncbi:uncharacterized protein PHALS_00697 [Plasmopara halstedii]|uniref:Uncharacterized protein n=1 Tax=Plasmopara halstedii TaxID=4781 RepID=A0A0P1ATR6_PLAHL|nr:uncharacterized protein PHALS_00697 [Plasmopara halstedii]CEG44328.1 hypothetical protein PHALS_00697 [Plasmopara halstedii]|eukprot:XP_024580697.1 hypothetical protein PHALS_00697 [Plasmopara halstedii]